MINRILVPYDDSTPASNALKYAYSNFPNSSITVLNVIDLTSQYRYSGEFEFTLPQEEHLSHQRDRMKRLLEDAIDGMEPIEGDVTIAIEQGHPPSVIIEFVREEDIDQIVMGSHGRTGISRFLFGSVAEAVVRRTTVPVVVVP